MPCASPKLSVQLYAGAPIKVYPRVEHFRNSRGYYPDIEVDDYRVIKNVGGRIFPLPCGKCLDCRRAQARSIAIRCVHESKQSPHNSFLTLTYDKEHIPEDGSYNKNHPVQFVKKLRDKLCRDSGCKIIYTLLSTRKQKTFYKHRCPTIKTYGCAEYGEKRGRPHFHLIIFGYDFPDRKYLDIVGNQHSDKKNPIYESKELQSLWEHGHSSIGALTMESAQYVAGYCAKKLQGSDAYNPKFAHLPKERSICVSRGIGLEWLKKFHFDLIINNSVVHKGKDLPIPSYYLRKLKEIEPAFYEALKEKRLEYVKVIDIDGTRARIATRTEIITKQHNEKKRTYEHA